VLKSDAVLMKSVKKKWKSAKKLQKVKENINHPQITPMTAD
jgi:hypothetical protein